MSYALRLVAVLPTEDDHLLHQRRQGWWLLVARISAGKTQADAAAALSLTAASSYGDFERGVTAPSLKQLRNLAIFFEVPLRVLTEPEKTDEERLEEETGRTSLRSAKAEEIDRIRKTG